MYDNLCNGNTAAAAVEALRQSNNVNMKDSSGNTLLHIAIWNEKLHGACANGNGAIIQLLLQNGADQNNNNNNGQTPIDLIPSGY
jgi:ankyrin repeat protein